MFTFEVARADARLFDEVLDWLVLNERLVSIQRLRNLCRDDVDRSPVEAVLAWTARSRRPVGATRNGRQRRVTPSRIEPLFREGSVIGDRTDETFRAHGWLKPPTKRSGKSRPPNTLAPINLAFRLRQILGIGARAEVVRFLLTTSGSPVTAQVVTESAGYAKRNVHEALTALHEADTVEAVRVGNEQRYEIDRARWAVLLSLLPEALPVHRDWPQLLAALRRLSRWLDDPAHDSKSEYMLASDARVLIEQIAPDLRYAGVRVARRVGTGTDYWRDFVALVDAALGALDGPPVSTNGSGRAALR
ncbi:MAG: hypothetical protein ACR2OB_08295 [Solirubrobacteraceae bacterium]